MGTAAVHLQAVAILGTVVREGVLVGIGSGFQHTEITACMIRTNAVNLTSMQRPMGVFPIQRRTGVNTDSLRTGNRDRQQLEYHRDNQ